jgi:acyl carrier protein
LAETLSDVLRRVIAKQIQADPATVDGNAALDDLGVTSLDLVEIIMTIEDEYNVDIPVDSVEAWKRYKTVDDLIELGRSLGLEGRRRGA